MKKIMILIVLSLLLIGGCVKYNLDKMTPLSQINDVKKDAELGKTVKVQGNVLDFVLDNGKKGYVQIQDSTGTIYLKGTFGALYENDNIKFSVDYAMGTLQKEILFGNTEYYVDITDLSAVKITENIS